MSQIHGKLSRFPILPFNIMLTLVSWRYLWWMKNLRTKHWNFIYGVSKRKYALLNYLTQFTHIFFSVAGGQGLSSCIRHHLEATHNKSANNSIPAFGASTPPHKLMKMDYINPDAPVWQYLSPHPTRLLPVGLRRNATDPHHLNQRTEEEIHIQCCMSKTLMSMLARKCSC